MEIIQRRENSRRRPHRQRNAAASNTERREIENTSPVKTATW